QEVTLHFAVAFSMSRLFREESPLKADAVRKVVDRLPSEERASEWRESKKEPASFLREKFFEPALHTNFLESGEFEIVGEGNKWNRKKPGSDHLPGEDIDDMTAPGPPQKVNPRSKAFRIFSPKKDK